MRFETAGETATVFPFRTVQPLYWRSLITSRIRMMSGGWRRSTSCTARSSSGISRSAW